jgi:hypothetical protein
MEPVEIVLKKRRGKRENERGVNLTKIYCKRICENYNVSPCTTGDSDLLLINFLNDSFHIMVYTCI